MVSAAAETTYYLWLAAGVFALLGGGYFVLLVQRWRALQAALAGLQAALAGLQASEEKQAPGQAETQT